MVARWFVLLVGLVLGAVTLVARLAHSGPEGPLSRAARMGDLPGIQALLAGGLDPNTPDGPRGFRPLASAARSGQLDAMAALLAAGADPNLRDAAGNRWIPLMHALHKHRMASVQFLLERGATADGPSGLSVTPLMMAVGTGQTDAARALLDRGANPRRRLPGGSSLLDLALSGGALTDIEEPLLGACHVDTVRLLLARAPDLRVSETWRGRLSGLFARWNGCGAALDLVNAPR